MPCLLFIGVFSAAGATGKGELRIGLVGLDTSHCVGWAAILNYPRHADHVPGGNIVAACKRGGYGIPHSKRQHGRKVTLKDVMARVMTWLPPELHPNLW